MHTHPLPTTTHLPHTKYIAIKLNIKYPLRTSQTLPTHVPPTTYPTHTKYIPLASYTDTYHPLHTQLSNIVSKHCTLHPLHTNHQLHTHRPLHTNHPLHTHYALHTHHALYTIVQSSGSTSIHHPFPRLLCRVFMAVIRKCSRLNGTRLVYISFKSTFITPLNRLDAVKLHNMRAAMRLMVEKPLPPFLLLMLLSTWVLGWEFVYYLGGSSLVRVGWSRLPLRGYLKRPLWQGGRANWKRAVLSRGKTQSACSHSCCIASTVL